MLPPGTNLNPKHDRIESRMSFFAPIAFGAEGVPTGTGHAEATLENRRAKGGVPVVERFWRRAKGGAPVIERFSRHFQLKNRDVPTYKPSFKKKQVRLELEQLFGEAGRAVRVQEFVVVRLLPRSVYRRL